ncbi:hypothetical protein B7486_55300, partial [cyanobacterium TDX16]
MKNATIATLVAAILLAGLGVATTSPAAAATTYVVQVTNDELDPDPGGNPADLSLREAWELAATDGTDSTITLQPGATYPLTRCGPADVQEDLNVDGDLDGPRAGTGDLEVIGRGATIQQTCPHERVLHHLDARLLALSGVTITGGGAGAEAGLESGGGVYAAHEDGRLHLVEATIRSNRGFAGGGVYASGEVEVDDSTFVGNSAVFAASALVANSGEDGIVRIRRSTVSHNHATGLGIAVYTSGPTLLHDSTVVANSAPGGIAANLGGEGQWVSRGSVVALGSGSRDCQEGLLITGDVANLDSDGTCFPGQQRSGLHPQLAPLAENGGLTPTHRPVLDSPALDVVPEAQCLYQGDQRAEPRPDRPGGSCDLGSVEEPPDPCAPSFPDVGATHPFVRDVCWLV